MPLRVLSLLFALCLGVLPGTPAMAEEVLHVLAWPGYADGDWVQQFEARYGVKVRVTIIDSDDALWQRMQANQGQDFDVFAVNTAELQRYIDAGRALVLDQARIPNTRNQQAGFRDLQRIPGITRGGRPYAIPFTYAYMGLIYNRKLVKEVPDSIRALWDPRYRGKVLAFDASSHNFSLAALAQGRDPFRFGEADWKPLARELVALRRNVLSFYSLPEEATELFLDHEVALVFANYGSQQVQALQQAGADIGYVIPREGALAWLDCWVINSRSERRELAEAWINFTLEPAISRTLTRRHGLANTLDPMEMAGAGKGIIWLEPVEDSERRALLWERIRSGDRLERF